MIWYVATLIASVFSTRGTAAQGAHGVREEPQFVTARAGESVVLGCDVSHPLNGQQTPYVVEWFKFGVPIPFFINFRFYPPHVDPEYAGRASLHGKASLQIDHVRSEDQGWYECRVLMLEQQYDTFHNGSWVHLTVNAPPTFMDTPPQYVEAREGGGITLTCTAFGNPKPVVTWLRDGDQLTNSKKYTVSDGSLTVQAITREDRGAYSCRAHSDQGEALHTTRLLVQGPPYIVSPPENITVNISQNAQFTCQAEAYPGNLTYTWYWEEDNVYFKNDLKLRVRIFIDGTLIIYRVKPEDAGKYTCSPSNSLGISPSASAYLTVQYPARVVNMPPVIYAPRKLPGIIRCPVDANPPVTSVRWEKDGYPLRIEKYPGWSQMADGSIRVAEVTEDSLGTYTCVPYNVLGTMGQSPPATLVLKDPPYFNVSPGGEYRQEAGRELVIPCAASGDPEIPTIVWRKVGKPSRSKHNILPSGSLQFVSLSKEDHGEWECVATNVVTSITASTRLFVIGTSPHAPTNVHVSASTSSANVSWEPGYDGGFEQTFSVWYGPVKVKNDLGPHDWLSVPVHGSQTWLVVQGLEPKTAYEFSVLAQNKLGTGPFSEVVTVTTGGYPISTPEPLVLLTPPRCLTANRTQQGVLLTWLPPANHSSPIDRYIIEFRLGERWEVLDDLIPATETEIIARDLIQDSWYEFRALAVMDDLVSESSNVVGVSSTDPFPPTEISDEGLAKPLVAGIVATICFLAAAILFSTLAACFVNKQHRRKLKRKRDPPLSITHTRKSIESPPPLTPLPGIEPYWEEPDRSSYRPPSTSPQLSSGKISPESITSSRPPSLASLDGHGLYVKKLPSPRKEKELSLYKKTKRAITSKKYSVSKHEAEVTTPIELISRGPDGRFVMDPSDIDTSLKPRRIEGFPFVEESDLYPEFRQSDEENDDPGPLPPVMATLRPQISPVSSSQESYMQPPAYSPRFQRPMEGMSISEDSRLEATGQSRVSHFHRVFPPGPFYGYLGSGAEVELHPPFYMPDVSPRSSAMSSSPSYPPEGPFRHPTIPEEREELMIHQYGASGHALPLVHSPPSSRSTEIWQPPDFPFLGQEGPRLTLPPHHSSYLHRDLPEPPPYPSHSRTLSTTSQLPSSSAFLQLEAPRAHLSRSPGRFPPQGPSAKHITMQQSQTLGQLRHTAHGMGVPVLPYLGATARMGSPSTLHSESSDGWRSEAQPWLSPRAARRMDLGLQQVVLQPSRLSPLTQTPPSSHAGSPDILVRPPPRPSILRSSRSQEMPESARHPASVSFSRRSLSSSPATSPTQGQSGQRPSLSYHAHMAFATAAASYPSQSPSPPAESSDAFGQMPSQRRTDEEMLPSEPSPGEHLGAVRVPAGSESFEALIYYCVNKAKKSTANKNNNSRFKKRTDVSTSQTQQAHASQASEQREHLSSPSKKKWKSTLRKSPCLHLSSLLRWLHPREDRKSLLASMDIVPSNYGSLL
ncbi:protein turtle homolog B-like isoform X1 [Carassius gibelio]|uniref:protein turtle homolog B-like isoform X1 n=1 Tax=Carassius gibelio TaxID=101364 RepID=UPI0022789BCD|nr:protein turtle homolog B-like isoform X1 [Carassius gibelio]